MLACLLAYCLVLLLLVPPRLLAVPLAHEGAHLLAALGLPPVRHAARHQHVAPQLPAPVKFGSGVLTGERRSLVVVVVCSAKLGRVRCVVQRRRPNVPQRFWGVAGRRKATFPLTAPGAVMWMRALCSVQQCGHLLLRPRRNGLTAWGKAGCAGRCVGSAPRTSADSRRWACHHRRRPLSAP